VPAPARRVTVVGAKVDAESRRKEVLLIASILIQVAIFPLKKVVFIKQTKEYHH
jgi:hypothetical protein